MVLHTDGHSHRQLQNSNYRAVRVRDCQNLLIWHKANFSSLVRTPLRARVKTPSIPLATPACVRRERVGVEPLRAAFYTLPAKTRRWNAVSRPSSVSWMGHRDPARGWAFQFSSGATVAGKPPTGKCQKRRKFIRITRSYVSLIIRTRIGGAAKKNCLLSAPFILPNDGTFRSCPGGRMPDISHPRLGSPPGARIV